MRLKDKVAIVTGGGTGIGKAIAMAFSREGSRLVVASRDPAKLEESVRQVKAAGGQAIAVRTDISDRSHVQHMVDRSLAEFGQVDVLVNGAAIAGPTTAVVDLEPASWTETLSVNLTGALFCAQEVLRSMIPHRRGSIINISGKAGIDGFSLRSPYAVSKAGLINFTKTLSMEVGKHNVRVNCIAPGPVQGERAERVLKAKAGSLGIAVEELVRQKTSRAALNRFVTEEEIASVAVFLASDESSGMTGQVLVIDGGTMYE
jgi:NAD(P)-dependent dehydrogenase (short-subunit alcohol dehydrogenase family)